MPRYNFRTLRGERIVKKKEGERMTKWRSEYEQFVNDNRNVLSIEEVRKEILLIFVDDAIEQTKVSLICPLTKVRIRIPVRYRTCRHFQCFDLKGFLAMKAKRNFLECPICNAKISNELKGLCIDKYFQKILSEINNSTKAEILLDGNYREVPAQLAFIVPKVIDDEEPFESERSTIHISKVKAEKSRDIASKELYELDHTTTLACEPESETSNNMGNIEEFGSFSNFNIDIEANDVENQLLHLSMTSTTLGIHQAAHSSNAKRIHTDERPFKCTQCSYKCARSDVLKIHMLTHTGVKPHMCSQCPYASAHAGHLKDHIRTHTGEKPFKCSQCSYACAVSSALKSHMFTHIRKEQKPYKCSQCSYVTAHTCNLKRHVRTHTGEKPYKCNKCSHASAVSSHLKVHMRTHTGEKPYKCNKCSYASALSSHLKVHMRTHTGEKPYKCNKCLYASAVSSLLKAHMLTHTGVKPYRCSQCPYTSAYPGHLKDHIRTHTGEKPFKCSQCSYASAVSSALKSHMRTHIRKDHFIAKSIYCLRS